MPETVCKILNVDLDSSENPKLFKQSYKSLNIAFNRSCIVQEVKNILELHLGKLEGLNQSVINALLFKWDEIPLPNVHLPKHYSGGLLFGQKVPRFDNRIIPLCRITGKKVPAKHTPEFYKYRWAMLLANIRVGDPLRENGALNAKERKEIHEGMKSKDYFTKKDLKVQVEALLPR